MSYLTWNGAFSVNSREGDDLYGKIIVFINDPSDAMRSGKREDLKGEHSRMLLSSLMN